MIFSTGVLLLLGLATRIRYVGTTYHSQNFMTRTENHQLLLYFIYHPMHTAYQEYQQAYKELLQNGLDYVFGWLKAAPIKMRRIADFKKTNHPLMHNLFPIDEKISFTDHQIVNVLTNKDHKGRRVLIMNCGKAWDPKQVNAEKMFRLFFLVHLVAQLEPSTQINGVVIIMDFDGLSLKQVRALSPSFSKLLLTFIQEAVPLRMKEVHIIKQPYVFNMVWALFKPFIGEKLRKRLEFHGSDMKKLHKYISPDCLPKNYGGTLPAINYGSTDWYPCIEKYVDHIAKWNTYGYANSP